MTSLVNKSELKRKINKYSKRTSMEDILTEKFEDVILRFFHAIIKIDNTEVSSNSKNTLTKEDIDTALSILNDEYELGEIFNLESTGNSKEKMGSLMVDNQELDINLNLEIDTKNGEVKVKK